ncbi:hypothetical protein [Halobacterium hubeiense]|uniref:hypothetical protein n=1 Tax=Halobacterium hubeiense TaxID=1407499 RepID=UPI003C70A81D
MKSKRVTAGVVTALLLTALAATGMPAAAANTSMQASDQLVVGSQHSTDSDFQNAQTLTNLTVDGSGESASVNLNTEQATFRDGFEDGNIDDWTATNGDKSEYSVVSSPVADGDYALQWTGSNRAVIRQSFTSDSYSELSFAMRVGDVSDGADQPFVGYEDGSGGRSVSMRIDDGSLIGDAGSLVSHYGGSNYEDTGINLQDGTFYRIVVTNIDYDNGTFAIEVVNVDTGSTVGTASDISFYDSGVTHISEVFVDYAKDASVDTIEVGAAEIPTAATYVSQVHDVTAAEQAAINIEQASNVSIEATVRTDGGTTLATDTFTSASNHTLNLSDTSSSQLETVLDVTVTGENPQFSLADESILFTNHQPEASNLSPEDNAKLDSRDTTFTIDVSDPEFATAQGDSVEARLFVDDQQVGSQTVTSNSTVSIDHQMSEGGPHTYHWELEDSYGGLTTTNQRTINVPSELTIYNVSAPGQLIDNAGEVELTFYTYDESNEVFTRSVSDGTVNLTGLPVDQEITVTANVNGYYSRQTIIESLYQQQGIYLLNDSRKAYETEFKLNDNTGGSFSKNEPRIIIERALNKSGNTQWVNVAGGRFGVNNYRTTLEAQERYRLTVKNSQGDSRVFYPYDAEAAQVVPLDVGSVSAEAAGGDSYTAEAAYRNDSGTPRVSFEYVDKANQTTSVSVHVYERGNQSNQLVNDTFTGEYGTLDLVWTIPENSTATSWVVEYSADRGDNTPNGRQIVGPRQTVLDQIPVWLKTIISVGSVFIVAGLFSRANGAIGGVITAAVGGMWWFVGFLPASVGVGVVALSFLTAGMIFVRDAGGGYL